MNFSLKKPGIYEGLNNHSEQAHVDLTFPKTARKWCFPINKSKKLQATQK